MLETVVFACLVVKDSESELHVHCIMIRRFWYWMEATSALDSSTEQAVMESIESLQGLKTMIIIAHRLTTIKNADLVYEVSGGNVTLRDKNEVIR